MAAISKAVYCGKFYTEVFMKDQRRHLWLKYCQKYTISTLKDLKKVVGIHGLMKKYGHQLVRLMSEERKSQRNKNKRTKGTLNVKYNFMYCHFL